MNRNGRNVYCHENLDKDYFCLISIMNIKQTIYDQLVQFTDSPSLPSTSSPPRQWRNLTKTVEGKHCVSPEGGGEPASGENFEKKKLKGSDFRERVMPTRAFCSFNPEWVIFHQERAERAETETDIFTPLFVFSGLTCWE